MSNKVYYKVNGREITEQDVTKFIANLGQDGFRFNSPEGKKQVAEELLNQELLLLDALDNGLDKEEDYKTEVEFVKDQILKQFAMKKILSSAEVTDEEAKEFYEKNPSHFSEVYEFHAYHILVKDEKEAKKIKEKIDNGADFEELAKEDSTCPSKEKGGDLGHFQSGQMVPEFEKALLKLKDGEVSEPVKTQFGYHIIRLDHKHLIKENNFESYKEDLKRTMISQKQQELYLNKTKKLKEKFDVVEGE